MGLQSCWDAAVRVQPERSPLAEGIPTRECGSCPKDGLFSRCQKVTPPALPTPGGKQTCVYFFLLALHMQPASSCFLPCAGLAWRLNGR